MTQVRFHVPPELANPAKPGARPCQVCLLEAKGDQVADSRDVWEALVNDGNDNQHWIPYPAGPLSAARHIREAVTRGFSEHVPGQLLELCWDHQAGLTPPDPRAVCTWCNGTGRKPGQAGSRIEPATIVPGRNGSHKRGGG